jgi:acyl dehydratase
MMLAYAAAIGETGNPTFDDANSASFVATPQFCVCLEWPVVSDENARALLGTTERDWHSTLHVGQDSFFHQPVRAGQRLRIEGTLMEVRAVKAGALTVCKVETVLDTTGAPVTTTWTTALMRGVTVEGDSRSMGNAPGPAGTGFAETGTVRIPIARELPHLYAECSDIHNPIHTERAVALAVGLPDIILQGTASWALAGREIIRRFAGGDPGSLRRLAGRFTGMIIPGGNMTLEYGLASDAERCVRFRVLNDEGITVLKDGLAELGET